MKHLVKCYEKFVTGESDYSRLINSSDEWEVIIEVNDNNWSGDILFLLKSKTKDDLYGYLTFGYGSCTGCDAYLRAEAVGLEELEKLRDELISQIHSDSKDQLMEWLFNTHDWEGTHLDEELVDEFCTAVKDWYNGNRKVKDVYILCKVSAYDNIEDIFGVYPTEAEAQRMRFKYTKNNMHWSVYHTKISDNPDSKYQVKCISEEIGGKLK